MTVFKTAVLFLLFSFAYGTQRWAKKQDILSQTSSYLTGRFTNEWQSVTTDAAVPGVLFFSTRIWPQRQDGIWLYVEENATSTAAPIRQRLYRFYYQGTLPAISFYSLVNPERYVGSWNRPRDFNSGVVGKELREGCDVYLVRQGAESFKGLDSGKNCTASIPEVEYLKTSLTASPYNVVVETKAFGQKHTEIPFYPAFEYNRIEGPCS